RRSSGGEVRLQSTEGRHRRGRPPVSPRTTRAEAFRTARAVLTASPLHGHAHASDRRRAFAASAVRERGFASPHRDSILPSHVHAPAVSFFFARASARSSHACVCSK